MGRAVFSPILTVVVLLASCGGSDQREKYGEAATVAVVAGAAEVITAARSRSSDAQDNAGECCAICDRCSFPCGDTCVRNGTLCMKSQGCACYESQVARNERLPLGETQCATLPDEPNPEPLPPVVPVVAY